MGGMSSWVRACGRVNGWIMWAGTSKQGVGLSVKWSVCDVCACACVVCLCGRVCVRVETRD